MTETNERNTMEIGHRPRFRRLAAITAALAASSLILAGCGGSGGDNGSAGGSDAKASPQALDAALKKGGTITYWSWTPSTPR